MLKNIFQHERNLSLSKHVTSFYSHKQIHTNNDGLTIFSEMFDHFPKIIQKLVKGHTVPEHFPKTVLTLTSK